MFLRSHSSVTLASHPSHSPGSSGLVARAWRILGSPQTEWAQIRAESTTSVRIFGAYMAPLAALAALAPILRLSPGPRGPGAAALAMAALSWGLELLAALILAAIVHALAPFFGGTGERRAALKVVAYSLTPLCLATIFLSTAPLAQQVQLVAGLYSTYLLYQGVGVLMKVPASQAFGYATTTLLCAVVILIFCWQITTFAGTLLFDHPPSIPQGHGRVHGVGIALQH